MWIGEIAETDGLLSKNEDFIPSSCSFTFSTSEVIISWGNQIAFIAESRAFDEDRAN